MDDFLTYLMKDCPAVAAVDGQAAIAYMRARLDKNPPASLLYMPEGPGLRLIDGEQLVIHAKAAPAHSPRTVVSLSEPSQGRSPLRSSTAAGVPIISVMRPPGQ